MWVRSSQRKDWREEEDGQLRLWPEPPVTVSGTLRAGETAGAAAESEARARREVVARASIVFRGSRGRDECEGRGSGGWGQLSPCNLLIPSARQPVDQRLTSVLSVARGRSCMGSLESKAFFAKRHGWC